MPAHLSPAWLAALDAAVTSHAPLAEATRGVQLVIEQVVTDDDSTVQWHVAFDDGSVRVVPGAAPEGAAPLVRFTTDQVTARAVATGTMTAQAAFMEGRLRVGGDTTALLAHHDLLTEVGDVFASVPLD
jgi:predicted lipid carrier protein YhbT